MKSKGKFIVFEGGDGCGKTTQLKLLEDYLKSKSYNVFSTKEPGGTKIGKFLRKKYLLNPKFNKTPALELFLFEAIRSEFVDKIIKPKLERGCVILSDRYHYATTAYQGYGRGLSLKAIEYCNKIASQNVKPDLVFIIDIPAEKGIESVTTSEFGEKDWFEKAGLDFHEKVNRGYREIAKKDPVKIRLIPYIKGGIDEMQEKIRNYVNRLLKITKTS